MRIITCPKCAGRGKVRGKHKQNKRGGKLCITCKGKGELYDSPHIETSEA